MIAMRRLLPVALGLLAGVVASPQAAETDATVPFTQWFRDATTDCQFQARATKPGAGNGGIWAAREFAVTATWSGSCVDGYATGSGVATVSVKPTLPASDGRDAEKEKARELLRHVPPFVARFFGAYDRGRPNGPFIIEHSNGVTVLATVKDGDILGAPVVHLSDGPELWSTLPTEQAFGFVESPWRNPFPKPLDPQERLGDTLFDPQGASLSGLFDVGRYADEGAFAEAIEQQFPRYSRALPLLKFLRRQNGIPAALGMSAPAGYCDVRNVGLLNQNQREWLCVFSDERDVGNGNTDRWIYTAVFAGDATLLHSETFRFFRGPSFAARNVPLKASNFFWAKDFLVEAKRLLGPSPTPEQVISLMESAGMSRGARGPRGPVVVCCGTQPTAEPLMVEYYREGSLMAFLTTGCGKIIQVSWEFDPQSRGLRGVTTADRSGCL